MAMALHSRWMGVDIKTIYATGGASANRAILQVMADVFGADVYQFEAGNAACVGAALRAQMAFLNPVVVREGQAQAAAGTPGAVVSGGARS